MPTTFERNLTLCFNKIKRLHQSPATPPPQPPPSHHHHRRRSTTTTKSTLIKNFNTLYDATSDSDDGAAVHGGAHGGAAVPDFSTAVASSRFFFSSPGRSNSIIESSSPSTSSLASTAEITPEEFAGAGVGVAIPTISPDPYYDFRRSMQEMVESRDLIDVGANWDYLHELLTCYLDLNPKSAHKFIVGAFADLLVSLMESGGGGGGGGGGCRNI